MVDTLDITLNEEAKVAFHIAKSIASEFGNQNYSAPHLLKAMIHKDVGLVPTLEDMGKDFYYMEEWAEVRIESFPKASKPTDNPEADDSIEAILNEADNIRIKLNEDQITPLSILASIATPGVGFSFEQLKSFPLKSSEITEKYGGKINTNISTSDSTSIGNGLNSQSNKSGKNVLGQYAVDKISKAKEGKLDPIIGRDKEIRMMTEILCRRSKPNVIIVGEPGVGKTALLEGFAQNIVNEKVPEMLKGAQLFELDFGSLIAGASYKGEIEDRLKKIIAEIKTFPKAILFIDEIHTLIDKNGSAAGAANLLKPELARGEITIIGATTFDEYRKFIESDEAFNRRFEALKVEEPDAEKAFRMLQIIAPKYQDHHELKISDSSLKEAVRLSQRYDKDRQLPDAAIDLIDRTMAGVKMMNETSKTELENFQNKLDEILNNQEISETQKLEDLKWFNNELESSLSPVLFGKLTDETQVEKINDLDTLINYLNSTISELQKHSDEHKDEVLNSDLAAVISHKTGIPIGKVQTQERERLMGMEKQLMQRVIGQDHAISSVSEAILESRSGISRPGQPIGSFFFLGPTGTGKTELAKSLAEFLFQDENAIIRFDMSEFKEEHSAALLYGAPPGYVGYEEGGLLVNKIRQNPYAIVLFDEIEKAHQSVFDIFLQILDEGKLHDRLGKEGDFTNAVVLFTSNIGSDFIVDSFGKGVIPPSNELMEIMGNYFRPEFLGRLTEIVPFSPITEDNVVKIFNIHLKGLLKILSNKGISLEIEEKAAEKLALSGFTPKYGARPIRGVIRNQIRRPLSKKIITGEVQKGNSVLLSLNENEEYHWEIK